MKGAQNTTQAKTQSKTQSKTQYKDNNLSYEMLALMIAAIWGFTFVVQKTAMDHTTPMLFGALRFSIAIPVLSLMVWWLERDYLRQNWRTVIKFSLVPGTILMLSSFFQQYALLTADASKAGLITSAYVCIVPFMAYVVGYKLRLMEIFAIACAFTGIYFLSVTASFSISFADILLTLTAFGWAAHIVSLDYSLRHIKPFSLALCQTTICAMEMTISVPFIEMPAVISMLADIPYFVSNLWVELLFSGIVSVGFAFGLQVFAQQGLSPSRVGLIFSTESLFAVFFGWLLLGELFNQREFFGATLLIFALIVVRLKLPASKAQAIKG